MGFEDGRSDASPRSSTCTLEEFWIDTLGIVSGLIGQRIRAGTRSPSAKGSEIPCLHDPARTPRTYVGPNFISPKPQGTTWISRRLDLLGPSPNPQKSPEPQSPQSFSLCFVQGEEDESKEATNCQGVQCRALDFGRIPARYLISRLLSELSHSFFLLPSYIASDEGGLKFQFRGFLFYQVSSLERSFRRLLENGRNK